MQLSKTYEHQKYEEKIYRDWERSGAFTPKIDPQKEPFTMLLPLPNANDPMHMGHALFTVQDILVRYHRMKGNPTLWLPGGDHAGIETQFVFEKKLTKEGKSRFDFDRKTLYQMIADFVEQNKDINRNQMKRLGFSLDWTRYHYSLEPKIVALVLDTFKKLHADQLVYRAEKLVNYCPKCGTAFSDLEVKHEEKESLLYYLDYGPIQIATVRPETIFADVAVAVNPKDKRYQNLIGQTAIIPLINKDIPIIGDETIDMEFGTGALKVTPAHDPKDYEIGAKHQLPLTVNILDLFGRLKNVPSKYQGLKVKAARELVAGNLKAKQKLVKTENYKHSVGVCYRCKTVIEPLLMPQWFVKTKPLAKPAMEAVRSGKTKIAPLKRFKKMYFDWLENIHDWNISRQIVWGPRLPVWYCLDCNPAINLNFIDKSQQKVSGPYQKLIAKYTYEEILAGLQSLVAPIEATYTLDQTVCPKCHGKHLIQETDTFDTWFLSGQWPMTTLLAQSENSKFDPSADGRNSKSDFGYFYPTSVLDTLWDILFFWVARMMMLCLYRTGKVPFEVVHLHSRVVDKHGQKMSKSKGNVVNPIEMVNQYGADALRFALVFGIAPGSDIAISDEKVRGMRNFANKLWNIARFILSQLPEKQATLPPFKPNMAGLTKEDQMILKKLNTIIKDVTKNLETYQFSLAAEALYQFIWHELADKYLEGTKARLQNHDLAALAVLRHTLINVLKLLHPFMPFITETIWQQIPKKEGALITASWPKTA